MTQSKQRTTNTIESLIRKLKTNDNNATPLIRIFDDNNDAIWFQIEHVDKHESGDNVVLITAGKVVSY